jgi:hypothetical protein
MPRATSIPVEKRQQAYEAYVNDPSKTIEDIRLFLGVSVSTFVRLRDRWHWPRREAAIALAAADRERQAKAGRREGEQATSLSDGQAMPASQPSSLRAAALALTVAARAHIDALLRQQEKALVDHDKAAKALASYADTLTKAQALLEQDGAGLDHCEHHHDGNSRGIQSRSIHELRDELARHLERIVAEEEARGSDGLLV